MTKEIKLSEDVVKYIRNELDCIKLRTQQIRNYKRKINALLYGISIKDVEHRYPGLYNEDEGKKEKTKGKKSD